MKISQSELYQQKYKQEMIQIDAFSANKMGLIQASTVLKIDKLQLICSPFQLSMQRAILLCVLSAQELPFFNDYKTKLTALKLSFQKPDINNEPLKLVIWTKINQIIPLKNKQNLCMVDLSYKNCPNDLLVILGHYLDMYKLFQNLFVRYKDKTILINPEINKKLRFNDYAEATINQKRFKIKVLSIAVNRLVFLMSAVDASVKPGFEFECKLYFQKYRFTVKGVVDTVSIEREKILKLVYTVKFASELVDIIHEYYLTVS